MYKIEPKNVLSPTGDLDRFFVNPFNEKTKTLFVLKEVFIDKNGFSPKNLNIEGELIFNEVGAVLPVSSEFYNSYLKEFTSSNFGEEVQFRVQEYKDVQVYESWNSRKNVYYIHDGTSYYSHETSRSYVIVSGNDFYIGSRDAPGPL
jgi:hypothetical protein